MRRMRLGLLIAIFVGLAVALAPTGCGQPPGARPKAVAPLRNPLEHFQTTNRNTVTPHGRIHVDSAYEQDGMIYYKTEDGKQWRVPYTRRADGYSYGTPEEVPAAR